MVMTCPLPPADRKTCAAWNQGQKRCDGLTFFGKCVREEKKEEVRDGR